MLTKRQFQILGSCADDEEVFYFPFARINYGGQVFSRKLKTSHPAYSQFEDDKSYDIIVPAYDIIIDIVYLIQNGYLICLIRDNSGTLIKEIKADVSIEEFSMYIDYDSLLFEDHIDKYGYGPHVFNASQSGIEEIQKDIYTQYRKSLG